jgi:hypothetical protein
MTTDILIKTYRADIPWLNESLKTIRKFWSGHRNVVIVCPPRDGESVRHYANRPNEICIEVDEGSFPGYIFQQAVKLNGAGYSDADLIVFSDSDCLWHMPTTPGDFIVNGKPLLMFTKWEDVPEAVMWRKPTELAIKRDVPAEFMRRHPLVYPRKTLRKMDRWFVDNHGMAASQLMLQFGQAWGASEFNWMGAWSWFYAHDDFTWLDTKVGPIPPARLAQFWSYGGIGEDAQQYLVD